jgi:hypothetical protein
VKQTRLNGRMAVALSHRRPIRVTGQDVRTNMADSKLEPHLHNEMRELVPQARNGELHKSADLSERKSDPPA